MTVKVNPPPSLKIPPSIIKDIEQRQFFEQMRTIMFQMWNRTGGNNDFVSNNEQDNTALASRVSRNSVKINSLEKESFDVETITADFITSRNQILICRNTTPITVTLDPNAINEDHIHIKRRGEPITVIGLVDGITPVIINIDNYSLHVVYDGVDWSQI